MGVMDIIINVAKKGNAEDKTIAGLYKLKWQLSQTAAVAGTFVAAGYAIKQVLDQTVGAYVSYAAEVRRASDATGMSTEETSRLIQVLDDVKIEYSALEKVIQKNGDAMDFSTAGLAAMSQQYMALGSAQERAAFMQERFGKSWVSFVPLMQLGGEAIQQMAASVDDGLVITQKANEETRRYEIAIDNLGDAFSAMTNRVGARFVPTLTTMAEGLTRSGEMTRRQTMGMAYLDDALRDGRISQEQYVAGVEKLGLTIPSVIEPTEELTAATNELALAQQAAAEFLGENMISTVTAIADAQGKYAEEVGNLNSQLAEGTITQDEYSAGIVAAGEALDLATDKMIFNLAQMQLAADGWQQADTAALLAIGQNLGLFSEQQAKTAESVLMNSQLMADAYKGLSTVTAEETPMMTEALNQLTADLQAGRVTAQGYREKVAALYNAVLLMDGASASATINLIVKGGLPGAIMGAGGLQWTTNKPGYVDMKASGGPLSSSLTMVGEKGYEMVVKGNDGQYTVIPHEAAKWLVQAGAVPAQGMASGGTLGGGGMGASITKVSTDNDALRQEFRQFRYELIGALAAAVQKVI